MFKHVTSGRIIIAAIALVIFLLAVGWMTRLDPSDKPYLQVLGKGFLFNYRISDVSYGFTVKVIRPLETGAIIESSFEDPSGGPDLKITKRVGTEKTRYGFQSPPVYGVKAGHPYRVFLRVMDREQKSVLWTHRFTVTSQISDDKIPSEPLTVGPGYTPNPDG